MIEITFLEQKPMLIHRCHRGNCEKRAKYTIRQDGKSIANMCLHHASRFCDKNDIQMPLMTLEQCIESTSFINDHFIPMLEKCGDTSVGREAKESLIEAAIHTKAITPEEGNQLRSGWTVIECPPSVMDARQSSKLSE